MDDTQTLETWDRLLLLLIARPSEGWEAEFEAITRREVARMWPAESQQVDDDE